MKNKITKQTTIPELTAIVYDHLTKNGISALLVGGSVGFHPRNPLWTGLPHT